MWSRLSISLKLALTMIVILGILGISDGVAAWRTQIAHRQVVLIGQKQTPFMVTTSNLAATFNHYDGVMNAYVLAANMKNWPLAAKKWTKTQKLKTGIAQDVKTLQHLRINSGVVDEFERAWQRYYAYALITHNAVLGHRTGQAIATQTVANSPATQAVSSVLTTMDRVAASTVSQGITGTEGNLGATVDTVLVAWVITVLIALGALWMQWRGIAVPLRQLAQTAEGLAGGDISQVVPKTSDDETGTLATAFRRLIQYFTVLSQAAGEMGQGNLTQPPPLASPKDTLGQALTTMHGQLRALLQAAQNTGHQVRKHAQSVRDLAEQAAQSTDQIASAVHEAAAASNESAQGLQHIAASMQQLKTAGDQVAGGTDRQAGAITEGHHALTTMQQAQSHMRDAVGHIDGLAGEAGQAAQDGRKQMEETLGAMTRIASVTGKAAEAIQRLGQRSNEIGTIVRAISDIAEQTNLLALNAAIEAARAGDAGRGFAVVADEVRRLAEQSAEETQHIRSLIQSIQEDVSVSVDAMTQGQEAVHAGQEVAARTQSALVIMEQSVAQVVTDLGEVTHSVHQVDEQSQSMGARMQIIAGAAQDNAAAATEMAASTADVADTVQGLAAIAEETAGAMETVADTATSVTASATQLHQQALALSEVADQLGNLVDSYHL